MADRGDQIRAVLAKLVDGKSRLGAAVVSRDGIPVASQMARPASEDSFAAMAAAVLGAAEGAIQEWAEDRPQHLTAEGAKVRIVLQGLDNDFFLAVVSPASANPNLTASMEIDAAAGRIRTILKQELVVFHETSAPVKTR